MEKITSIKDQRIVEARSLNTSSERRKNKRFLLEGKEIIQWALDASLEIERIFIHDRVLEETIVTKWLNSGIECFSVSEGIIKKIYDKRYLIPFVGVAKFSQSDSKQHAKTDDFIMVLDDVRDHGNIGTIVRTAKGFGIQTILSSHDDFDPFIKKTIEASRGTIFKTDIRQFNSPLQTIDYLKKKGYQIISTSPHAPVLQSSIKLQAKPIALVVGNETTGICQEFTDQADVLVKIPMSSDVESLNVGVATGISVYEFKLKLVIAMLLNYIRSTLGRELNVTWKHVFQVLDKRILEVSPFNSLQVIFLMILKCDGVMSLEQISKDTATFAEERHELLQPLLNAGYIVYTDTKKDVTLTLHGENFLGEIWPVVETAEQEVLKGFTEQEKKQLRDFLKRIQTNCQGIVKS